MSISEEVRISLQQLLIEKENRGGFSSVVWLGAGGSCGGFYAAQYFMDHEAKTIRSQVFTSNEFVYATPSFVNENTLAVVCSMRGTPETIEAAKTAKAKGASVIALYVEESGLTETADIAIRYQSIAVDESRTERVNSSIALNIAVQLTGLTEGYAYTAEFERAFETVDEIYRRAFLHCTPLAESWAADVKNEKTIYVMASGPSYGSAYIFSICNIEEMLQIDSPTVNCCEFFHGPFEVIDADKPVFLLKSAGRTAELDERAIRFLSRYGGDKVYILSAEELGINELPAEVREYFHHVLFSPILNNVYMRHLSYATGKDYTTRRYMWQFEY